MTKSEQRYVGSMAVPAGRSGRRSLILVVVLALIALAAGTVGASAPASAATDSGLQLPPVCTTRGQTPYEQSFPPPPLSLFQPASGMTYCRAGIQSTGQGLESQTLTGASKTVTFTLPGGYPTFTIGYCGDPQCTTKKTAPVTGAIYWPQSFDNSGMFDTVTSADTPWDPTTRGWRKQPSEINFRLTRTGTCGTENESNGYVSGPTDFSCTYSIEWFTKPKHDAVVSFGNLFVSAASPALEGKKVGGICYPSKPGGPYDNCSNFVGVGPLEAVLLFSKSSPVTSPPTVDFTSTAVRSPLNYQFVATAKAAPDATVTSYAWDFGDHMAGVGKTPTHTYAKAGTYHVKVTVTDSNGQQTTVARDLVVTTALVVNSTADTANGTDSGTNCDTGGTVGTPAMPECTLRAAIQAANAGSADRAPITFDIVGAGTPTIALGSALPDITRSVSIDGTTQSGGWVQLTGSATVGLTVHAAGSVVKGLTLTGFTKYGVAITSAAGTKITHVRIGADAAGTATMSTESGIVISDSPGVTIGGAAAADGNLIVPTSGFGVATTGDAGSAGLVVSHNTIGADVSGSTATSPSLQAGVVLGADADAATVADNLIEASVAGVVLLGQGPADSTVKGNTIGLDRAGKAVLTSPITAIYVSGTPRVAITGNRVTASVTGISVAGSDQTFFDGTSLKLPTPSESAPGRRITGGNAKITGNTVGALASGVGAYGIVSWAGANDTLIENNTVAGHTSAEIQLFGGKRARVLSSQIGLDRSGTKVVGGNYGIFAKGTESVVIGARGEGNFIGGLKGTAVDVSGTGANIAGNRIGFAANGSTPAPVNYGIIDGASGAVIGPANTIGNVASTAIIVAAHADGSVVTGNRLGLATSGAPAPNGSGIDVDRLFGFGPRPPSNVVVTGNVVAASTKVGITVAGENTTVDHNTVGTDATGNTAVANQIGIRVKAGAAHSASLTANLVSGNLGTGIEIVTSSAKAGVTLTDNRIGVRKHGGGLPNATGVTVTGPGKVVAAGNVVAYNRDHGWDVAGGSRTSIQSGPIYANGDHAGIAFTGAAPLTISGTIRAMRIDPKRRDLFVGIESVPGTGPVTVEWFANISCADPEGRIPLLKRAVIGGQTSIGLVDDKLITTLGNPKFLTATVTDAAGRTSAFSPCIPVEAYRDQDEDGVSDLIEALGPNHGDNNHDGVPDAEQPDVATFITGVNDNISFVTLVSPAGTRLQNVAPVPLTGITIPAGIALPSGLYYFDVQGVDPGGSVVIDVILGSAPAVGAGYLKTLRTPAGGLTVANFGAVGPEGIGSERTATGWRLHLVDGQPGDTDESANGRISDPGGPATGRLDALAAFPLTTRVPAAGPAAHPLASTNAVDVEAALRWAALLLVFGFAAVASSRRVVPLRVRSGR